MDRRTLAGQPRRVAVIILSPAFATHVLGYFLGAAMQDRGDEVLVAVCHGMQARCMAELNTFAIPRGQQCRSCAARSDERWRQWTDQSVPLEPLDAWLSAEAMRDLETTVDGLPDVSLPDFEWRGWPVGRWATLGLQLERFGESWRDVPDWPDRLRRWLRATMAAGQAAGALIDDFRPDAVLVLDGALPAERAVWAAARERGCRTVLYEGGQVYGSWLLRDETPASAYDLSPEWQLWRQVPLSAAERRRLQVYLQQRTRREAPDGTAFSPPATGEVAALRDRLHLPADQKVVIAFTSVTADAPSLYAAGVFASQLDWLDACVAMAAERPDVVLVVRIHPAESLFHVAREGAVTSLPEPMAAVLTARWPVLPDNVRLVGADDPVSSYDLLALADLTLVYISTLALEATAMGHPAIVCGQSHYAARGIVPSPATAADLPRLVDDLLGRPRLLPEAQELAWRYLYLWFFRVDVRLKAVTIEPWAGQQVLAPGDRREADDVLERLIAYVRGEASFLPPPADWRPRDQAGARPLTRPAGESVLVVPDGLDEQTLAREVLGPAAASGSDVVVVTGGLGWSEAVALCETACRRLGGPESWPAVRLLPTDVPDGDWVAWVMRVQAVVMTSGQGPLAAMAAEAGALCLLAPAEAVA